MTGTAAELVPVREVDDHAVGTGKPGEITRAVQSAFEDALHGRTERYREWLDPVPGRAERRSPRPSRPRDASDIELYDATLRDGMQGDGMTLSAAEKVRVARKLDELGVAPHRGRLPGVEPQGARALRAAGPRSASSTPRSPPSA